MPHNLSNNEILETCKVDTIMNEFARTNCKNDDQRKKKEVDGSHISSNGETGVDLNSRKNSGNRMDSLSQPNSNFPSKLHIMLHEIHRDNMEHIVSWQSHGRCFIVHDIKEFENKILPRYVQESKMKKSTFSSSLDPKSIHTNILFFILSFFQQTKYPSFQRQLSFYGLRRVTSGKYGRNS